jgi:hypothetical protein
VFGRKSFPWQREAAAADDGHLLHNYYCNSQGFKRQSQAKNTKEKKKFSDSIRGLLLSTRFCCGSIIHASTHTHLPHPELLQERGAIVGGS